MSSGVGANPVVRHHEARQAVSRVSFSPVHLPFVQLYMRAFFFFFVPLKLPDHNRPQPNGFLPLSHPFDVL